MRNDFGKRKDVAVKIGLSPEKNKQIGDIETVDLDLVNSSFLRNE